MIKSMFKLFSYSYKAHKPFFYFALAKAIFTSLSAVFSAYAISMIIALVETGNTSSLVSTLLIVVSIEIGLLLVTKVLDYYASCSKYKLLESIDHMIAKKVMEMPFQYLEDPNYIELKRNSDMGIKSMGAIYSFVTSLLNIFSDLLTIIGLIAVIFQFDFIIVIILVVGFVIHIGLVVFSLRTINKIFSDILDINFKYDYFLETLADPHNGKDYRLFGGVYDGLFSRFSGFNWGVTKSLKKIYGTSSFFSASVSLLSYIEMGIVYALVGVKTLLSGLPISQFTLIVSSAIRFSTSVDTLIEEAQNLIRSIQYCSPFIELMEVDNETLKGDKKLEHIDTLEFKNVTFKYPNTDRVILDDISFKVNKNEKISIVGLNGAGKTTIVKLISRLYKPTEGKILINDTPIEEYDIDSYTAALSAVYQDFKLFNYEIKNVIKPNISDEEVYRLIEEVGIKEKIDSLDEKVNSKLGKDLYEGGVELSGGQLQKIAIARSLAKKEASLLILDEPTSALDPLAEAEIYTNFNSLAQNRMALYISHRMASSLFCDKVLVLNGGKIEDFAPHADLMKKNGLYCKLFQTQAKNYKE